MTKTKFTTLLNFNRLRPPPRQSGQNGNGQTFSARQAHAAIRGNPQNVNHTGKSQCY